MVDKKKWEADINALLGEIKEPIAREKVKDFFLISLHTYVDKIVGIEKSIEQDGQNPDKFWQEFNKECLDIAKLGDSVVSGLNKRILRKKVKDQFRVFISPWAYQGEMFNRAYRKPRGYPGDYRMLEGMYNNQPWSKGGIGYLYDKFLLDDAYVNSVKKRKDTMKTILEGYLANIKSEVDIMNLGSGSGREVREIFSNESHGRHKVNYIFVDQDDESLSFLKNRVQELNVNSLSCNYLNENLLSFVKKANFYKDKFGEQDLIYSIGVFDYLPDQLCQNVFEAAFSLLKKKGRFIVAYKLVKEVKSLGSDWFCDWYFYPRNDKEIVSLAKKGLANQKMKLDFVSRSDKRIHFISIEKI